MKAQEQLGMRVKFLRKQKHWSQEDLALESNINKNYICDLENGRRNPSDKTKYKLAKIYKVEPVVIFEACQRTKRSLKTKIIMR